MKVAVFGAGTMGSGIAQVFAAKGHVNSLPKHNSDVFYGMMTVHFQITFHTDGQIEASMLAYLFQHVVEEA